jgi:hypothetical protein
MCGQVVELDHRLIVTLRSHVPHANVLQGDALTLVREIPFGALNRNLANYVTDLLIDILELPFRTAVLAVGASTPLDGLPSMFPVTEVTTMSGDDFRPSQPTVSRIVKISRTSA